jgi:hypothetical protein
MLRFFSGSITLSVFAMFQKTEQRAANIFSFHLIQHLPMLSNFIPLPLSLFADHPKKPLSF